MNISNAFKAVIIRGLHFPDATVSDYNGLSSWLKSHDFIKLELADDFVEIFTQENLKDDNPNTVVYIGSDGRIAGMARTLIEMEKFGKFTYYDFQPGFKVEFKNRKIDDHDLSWTIQAVTNDEITVTTVIGESSQEHKIKKVDVIKIHYPDGNSVE